MIYSVPAFTTTNSTAVPEADYFNWTCPFNGSMNLYFTCEGNGGAGNLTATARHYRNGSVVYESDVFSHRGSSTNNFVVSSIKPGDVLCIHAKGE